MPATNHPSPLPSVTFRGSLTGWLQDAALRPRGQVEQRAVRVAPVLCMSVTAEHIMQKLPAGRGSGVVRHDDQDRINPGRLTYHDLMLGLACALTVLPHTQQMLPVDGINHPHDAPPEKCGVSAPLPWQSLAGCRYAATPEVAH